jgi:4-amino-4-deoxy-L-arabinose transferase-like glycosyltransferase
VSGAATAERGLPLPASAAGPAGTRAAVARAPAWLPPALLALVAALLRLPGLGSVRVDPFYDAAVRSMGTSWHAFLTGAIDPSAGVAVDKPPVDLWLQVASTRLLGFTPTALHLPEALGGVAAVVALYDLLRVLFGRGPAIAGALALAVLPMAVITARSDTMDSVMAALVVGAAALTARAARDDRPGLLLAAGAVLGLAFEVKLFEALVGAPALAALWWVGARAPRRRRAAALAGAGAVFVAVALAWLVALPVLGGPHRPWAFGSTNGSAWNATFVYDGLDRLRGLPAAHTAPQARAPGRAPLTARQARARTLALHRRAAALDHRPADAGPTRLFSSRAHLGRRIGIALAAALAAFGLALWAGVPRDLDRIGRAGWWALGGWLATGLVLFSAQGTLKPRYLEAFDPAVAAILGAGVVLAGRRLVRGANGGRGAPGGRGGDPRPAGPARPAAARLGAAALLVALLAGPAVVSVQAAAARTEDAGAPGALPAGRLARLSAYLQAHRDGARYETASVAVGKAASLIARDGQPVLVLTTTQGRALTSVASLARAVRSGHVRSALVGAACTPSSADRATGCSPQARWIRAHGADVSRAAGQPHPGLVYALGARAAALRARPLRPGRPPALSAGRRTRSARSAASTRTRRRHRGRPRRASRARHRRCGRARPSCRGHSRSSAAR